MSSKATEPGIDTQMLHVVHNTQDAEENGHDEKTASQSNGESHVYNIAYKQYDLVTDFNAIPYEDETCDFTLD